MEDLEINPLYRAYLTTYRREFDLACKMSHLLAIPHSDTLENLQIDQTMINSHILVPSKLLKMHYSPLQTSSISTDIELDGKKLIVNFERRREHSSEKSTKSKIIVNILDEEMSYNSHAKEYRTILIDRPLLFDQKKKRILKLSKKSQSNSNLIPDGQWLRPKKQIRDQDDCSRYLESISQEITVNLESEIRLMQSNYIILSKFLDDASERIRSVCESYIPRYERMLMQNIAGNSHDTQQQKFGLSGSCSQAVRLSVENYVMYLLHGKIIACIHELYENHDKKMLTNFDIIQRTVPDITSLGAQAVFSDFHITDDLSREISNLPNSRSPLAIVSSLTKTIELIKDMLNQNVKFKQLIGFDREEDDDDQTSLHNKSNQSLDNDLVSICSDDLIASLVYCFANIKPARLYSTSQYLSIFGWSSTTKDQQGYNATTFNLVVQYIYSYSSQTLSNPRSRQLNDRLNSSNPIPRSIVSAKPKRVQSVKSMDSLSYRRNSSRLSLSTHFSLLDASTEMQKSSREDQTNLDFESIGSSSSSSATKSGWIFL